MNSDSMVKAVKGGDTTQVEKLLEGGRELAAARSEDGVSVILLALYYGRREMAETLAAARADLDLFEASAIGSTQRARTLLERDPELVGSFSPDGFTPLHLAAYFGQKEAVDLLLARGAPTNIVSRNPMQVQPLHSALANHDRESAEAIAEALIAHGADVNARQRDGFAPLHAAAQNGNARAVRLLLSKGADPGAATASGKTALNLAVEANHGETAEAIRRDEG